MTLQITGLRISGVGIGRGVWKVRTGNMDVVGRRIRKTCGRAARIRAGILIVRVRKPRPGHVHVGQGFHGGAYPTGAERVGKRAHRMRRPH